MSEISIRVGGAAGDGIASIGDTVAKSLTRMGLHLFGLNAYQSVIRGGHVWFQARASTERVYSQGDGCDILFALNKETADVHLPTLRQGGALIFDPEKFTIPPTDIPVGSKSLAVPTLAIARKYTSQSILQNAAGLGAAAFLAGIPLEILQRTLADSFGKKKGEVVDWNLGASKDGYEFASKNASPSPRAAHAGGPPKLLMTGNQAIALGAAAAGCKFLAQYPMTPASTIMHWMAAHSKEIGVVVKQAEDELAAINMAIGASFGGVRSMTATSGGGFSLMVEALGMAGMTETPLVVVESQRSGPSTGLPTKTEQGDLNLMLGAGQGEFPRAILAPSQPSEAYEAAVLAFRLAEEFQTPILLASDFHLSESVATVEPEEINLNVEIPSLFTVQPNGDGYKRYRYTESGVSPRSLPGQAGLNYVAGSDEHDEAGHLISDVKSGIPIWVAERKKMMDKRMRKLSGLLKATPPPRVEGSERPQVTLVAWGSTVCAVRDAMKLLDQRGVPTRLVQVRTVYPVHVTEMRAALQNAGRTLLVEANFSGQLGRLLRAEAGIEFPDKLLKYDGEPFYPMEIVAKVQEMMGHVGS
jgi:2-oxoglutarate/2-oxoacid ferredoxin oxidoreductase subunit alpha